MFWGGFKSDWKQSGRKVDAKWTQSECKVGFNRFWLKTMD